MADRWLCNGYVSIPSRIIREICTRAFTRLQTDILLTIIDETGNEHGEFGVVTISARELAEKVKASERKTEGAIKALLDGGVLSDCNKDKRRGGPRALSLQTDCSLWLIEQKGKIREAKEA